MIRRLAPSQRSRERAAIAALMNTPAPGAAMPRSAGDDAIALLVDILEAHHAPPKLIERLAAAAAKSPSAHLLPDRLGIALAEELRFALLADLLRAPALLLLGPPAAGKTTLAAKLAAHLGEGNALLINADPDRADGSARLAECAAVLGLPLADAVDADALRSLAGDAHARRPVVIDTKGIAPNDDAGCAVLAELVAASGATPLLVLPADTAADEAAAMAQRFASIGARVVLPTRLDLVRRLGGVLAAANAGRLALCAAAAAPQFAYGLRALTPLLLARLLLSDDAAPQAADVMPA